MLRSVVIACGLAGTAAADDDRIPVIEVAVGKTVEREVGYAIGYLCDDLTIIDVEMKAKTFENNAFVVTGKKVGATQCRVGMDPDRPTILYDVRVVEAPKPPPPKPPAKK